MTRTIRSGQTGLAAPATRPPLLTRAVDGLQPRDYAHAGRVVSVLLLVAAGVTAAFAVAHLATDGPATGQAAVLVASVGVLVVGYRARSWTSRNRWAWAVVPIAATALIVVLDYVSHDASVSAQVFFLFPALYGASELRRPGALALGGVALVGEAVLVFGLLDLEPALTQFTYVAAALLTAVLLLTRANESRARLIERLTDLAGVDALTGLVTRRVLDEAAHAALAGADPGSSGGTGLILLDVDRFKTVNDEHGHLAGDDVLVQLSRLLTATVRPQDVVSRLGGDEIAVLLPGCTPYELARRGTHLVEQVRRHPFTLPDGQPLVVTLSAGMAHAPTDGVGLRELYSAADTGLYGAKRAGRDQLQGPRSEEHERMR